MAMNGNTMGTAVKDAIKAEMVTQGLTAWSAGQEGDAESFWQAICGAIVTHITNNATLTGTATTTGIADTPGGDTLLADAPLNGGVQ